MNQKENVLKIKKLGVMGFMIAGTALAIGGIVSIEGNRVSNYKELMDAYSKMVIHEVSGAYAKKPGGMSIYLPGGDNSLLTNDYKAYRELDFCKEYQRFAGEYVTYLTGDEEQAWNVPAQDEADIVLKVQLDQLSEIADAYSTFFVKKDDIHYMLLADGDVKLDLSGYLKAPMENTFWGLKEEPLCLIERYSTENNTEYQAPVLYKKGGENWVECMVYIMFSEDNPYGTIEDIVPCEVSKQVYHLEEGDKLIPLYPLYEAEPYNVPEIAEGERIYKNEYYKGNVITMEDMEMGDGELEKITLEKDVEMQYGFLIRDTKMELYYTDFANSGK
jgi:hypothetical protein